jgi:hypothetical protein
VTTAGKNTHNNMRFQKPYDPNINLHFRENRNPQIAVMSNKMESTEKVKTSGNARL